MKYLICLMLSLFSVTTSANMDFASSENIKKQLQQMQGNVQGEDKPPLADMAIFVSLSMPESSLEALLKSADHFKVPVFVRGVIGGDFEGTIQKWSRLFMQGQDDRNKSVGGVSIDPNRFKQFNIEVVPAFVIINHGKCALSTDTCTSNDYDKMTGNVRLKDALTTLRTKGDYPEIAQSILDRE